MGRAGEPSSAHTHLLEDPEASASWDTGVATIAGYALVIRKPDGRTVVTRPTKAVLRSAPPAGGVKGVLSSSDDEPEDAGEDKIIERIPLDRDGNRITRDVAESGAANLGRPSRTASEESCVDAPGSRVEGDTGQWEIRQQPLLVARTGDEDARSCRSVLPPSPRPWTVLSSVDLLLGARGRA